jgi:DNA invertase Pin-like site-specific DNA recombinase
MVYDKGIVLRHKAMTQQKAARKIGYARVSTYKQDEASQIAALKAAGCEKVFAETVSTTAPASERAELQALLAELRDGDDLVVAKLDRLGRTQVEVINRLDELQKRGVHVETLDGFINTRALGKLAPIVVGLITGLAEVERNLIRERTLESIEYRRSKGLSLGGRPKSFSIEQAEMVLRLREDGVSMRKTAASVGLTLGVVQRIVSGEVASKNAS